MKTSTHLPLSLLLLAALAMPAAAETAEAILTRMDASAPSFRSVESGFRRIQHTAIINEDLEENGSLKMVKSGGKTAALIELTKPNLKNYHLTEAKVEVFLPKIATVQEYEVGKQKGLVEQFLLLGFGSSGKDLAKNYLVKGAGEEAVEGQPATKLELTPKSPKVLELFTKVEIWIPAGASYAVKQRVNEKSGDTMTFFYTDVKMNTGLAASAVELKLPPGAKREFPGK